MLVGQRSAKPARRPVAACWPPRAAGRRRLIVALFLKGLAVLALSRRWSGSLRIDPVWSRVPLSGPLPRREGGARIGCPTSGRSLQRDRGAIPREPSSGRHSQAILGPHGRHPEYVLDDTDKGREAFSKIKGVLRDAQARTRRTLLEALGQALSTVTAQDARGFFEHCGYHLAGQPL